VGTQHALLPATDVCMPQLVYALLWLSVVGKLNCPSHMLVTLAAVVDLHGLSQVEPI
jgi:hypothetical protein